MRRRILSAVLEADTGLKPIPVTPDADWLHVMEQITERGKLHVIYNTKLEGGTESVQLETAAGPLELITRNRWPALAAVTEEGSVVALSADGASRLGEQRLLSGVGLKAVLSLDGRDIRRSDMLLVAPFEPGRVELPERTGGWTAVCGDFRQGKWRTLEQVSLGTERTLKIDEDRATCLILIAPPANVAAGIRQLTETLLRPDLPALM